MDRSEADSDGGAVDIQQRLQPLPIDDTQRPQEDGEVHADDNTKVAEDKAGLSLLIRAIEPTELRYRQIWVGWQGIRPLHHPLIVNSRRMVNRWQSSFSWQTLNWQQRLLQWHKQHHRAVACYGTDSSDGGGEDGAGDDGASDGRNVPSRVKPLVTSMTLLQFLTREDP